VWLSADTITSPAYVGFVALRDDEARVDVERPDALRRVLSQNAADKRVPGGLSDPVTQTCATLPRRSLRIPVGARDRADHHDRAGAALEHAWQEHLRDPDRRDAMRLDELAVLADWRLEDRVHQTDADVSAVLHHHVDRAPRREDLLAGRLHRRHVDQIHTNRQRFTPARGNQARGLLERAGQRPVSLDVNRWRVITGRVPLRNRARRNRDVVPSVRERERDRLADAATCASHQCTRCHDESLLRNE
jgi:hypothetical protein